MEVKIELPVIFVLSCPILRNCGMLEKSLAIHFERD
jgi:hypothetical protein